MLDLEILLLTDFWLIFPLELAEYPLLIKLFFEASGVLAIIYLGIDLL